MPPPASRSAHSDLDHSISDEPKTGHHYYWINTSPALFADHMRYLADHGYEVIPLSRAIEMIRSHGEAGRGSLVVGCRKNSVKCIVFSGNQVSQ